MEEPLGFFYSNFNWLKDEFFHVFPTDDLIVDPRRLRRFDLQYWSQFTEKLWIVPLICILIYVPFVLVGPKILHYFSIQWRPKKLIAIWNLLLSIFSIIGASVTVKTLLSGPNGILTDGLFASACGHAQYGYGYTGFFVFLFIYSKLFELFDTYWLVVGDRNVICLHWYHHVTVLLYCWHAYSVRTSIGLWFVAMNYVVHSVMYLYFFLSQIGNQIRKKIGKYKHLITILQITQMFVGATVCIYSLCQEDCKANRLNAFLGCVMYLSYFYLFTQLFIRILTGKHKPTKPQQKHTFTTKTEQDVANLIEKEA